MVTTEHAVKLTGQTYGSALGKIFDDMNTVVQNALSTANQVGLQIILEAAQQVQIAAANAAITFKLQEKLPSERVSDEAQKALKQLQAMVVALQSDIQDQIGSIKGNAILLIQALPFASTQPRVISAGPAYMVVTANKVNTIIFKGGFPVASDPDYMPTFTLEGIPCTLIRNTDKELAFQIPNSALKQPDGHTYTNISSGVLNVPWDNGWVFSHVVNAVYHFGVNLLPAYPANRILAAYTASVIRHEDSPPIQSQSCSIHGLNFNGKVTPTPYIIYDVFPRSGWKINVRKEPVPTVTDKGNKSGHELIHPLSPNGYKVKVWCNAHNSHENANGWITVVYTHFEERDIPAEEPRVEEHSDLKWGDSRILTPREHEEFTGLVIDDYKGVHTETGAAANITSPVHLMPIDGGQQWRIEAVTPEEIPS